MPSKETILPTNGKTDAGTLHVTRMLRPASGFTLVEVLAALGLCVLLAGVAATAAIQANRSLSRAEMMQEQALRLRGLHAEIRRAPDPRTGLESLPASDYWLVSGEELIVPPPRPPRGPSRSSNPVPPRHWTLLTLREASGTLRPVHLAILETEEP